MAEYTIAGPDGSSESSSDEEDNSSSSDCSTDSSEDEKLEVLQFDANTKISLPQGLCDREDVFREFFSAETFNSLSDDQRQHLASFLPNFPENDEAEKNKTLQMLLSGEQFRFTSPLTDFFNQLQAGHFHPDISKMRSMIKAAEKREARLRYRRYRSQLEQEVVASRDQLLKSLQGAPPGAANQRIGKQLNQNAPSYVSPIAFRTKRRYFQHLAVIRMQVNQDDVSSDENYPEGYPTSPITSNSSSYKKSTKQKRPSLTSTSSTITQNNALTTIAGTEKSITKEGEANFKSKLYPTVTSPISEILQNYLQENEEKNTSKNNNNGSKKQSSNSMLLNSLLCDPLEHALGHLNLEERYKSVLSQHKRVRSQLRKKRVEKYNRTKSKPVSKLIKKELINDEGSVDEKPELGTQEDVELNTRGLTLTDIIQRTRLSPVKHDLTTVTSNNGNNNNNSSSQKESPVSKGKLIASSKNLMNLMKQQQQPLQQQASLMKQGLNSSGSGNTSGKQQKNIHSSSSTTSTSGTGGLQSNLLLSKLHQQQESLNSNLNSITSPTTSKGGVKMKMRQGHSHQRYNANSGSVNSSSSSSVSSTLTHAGKQVNNSGGNKKSPARSSSVNINSNNSGGKDIDGTRRKVKGSDQTGLSAEEARSIENAKIEKLLSQYAQSKMNENQGPQTPKRIVKSSGKGASSSLRGSKRSSDQSHSHHQSKSESDSSDVPSSLNVNVKNKVFDYDFEDEVETRTVYKSEGAKARLVSKQQTQQQHQHQAQSQVIQQQPPQLNVNDYGEVLDDALELETATLNLHNANLEEAGVINTVVEEVVDSSNNQIHFDYEDATFEVDNGQFEVTPDCFETGNFSANQNQNTITLHSEVVDVVEQKIYKRPHSGSEFMEVDVKKQRLQQESPNTKEQIKNKNLNTQLEKSSDNLNLNLPLDNLVESDADGTAVVGGGKVKLVTIASNSSSSETTKSSLPGESVLLSKEKAKIGAQKAILSDGRIVMLSDTKEQKLGQKVMPKILISDANQKFIISDPNNAGKFLISSSSTNPTIAMATSSSSLTPTSSSLADSGQKILITDQNQKILISDNAANTKFLLDNLNQSATKILTSGAGAVVKTTTVSAANLNLTKTLLTSTSNASANAAANQIRIISGVNLRLPQNIKLPQHIKLADGNKMADVKILDNNLKIIDNNLKIVDGNIKMAEGVNIKMAGTGSAGETVNFKMDGVNFKMASSDFKMATADGVNFKMATVDGVNFKMATADGVNFQNFKMADGSNIKMADFKALTDGVNIKMADGVNFKLADGSVKMAEGVKIIDGLKVAPGLKLAQNVVKITPNNVAKMAQQGNVKILSQGGKPKLSQKIVADAKNNLLKLQSGVNKASSSSNNKDGVDKNPNINVNTNAMRLGLKQEQGKMSPKAQNVIKHNNLKQIQLSAQNNVKLVQHQHQGLKIASAATQNLKVGGNAQKIAQGFKVAQGLKLGQGMKLEGLKLEQPLSIDGQSLSVDGQTLKINGQTLKLEGQTFKIGEQYFKISANNQKPAAAATTVTQQTHAHQSQIISEGQHVRIGDQIFKIGGQNYKIADAGLSTQNIKLADGQTFKILDGQALKIVGNDQQQDNHQEVKQVTNVSGMLPGSVLTLPDKFFAAGGENDAVNLPSSITFTMPTSSAPQQQQMSFLRMSDGKLKTSAPITSYIATSSSGQQYVIANANTKTQTQSVNVLTTSDVSGSVSDQQHQNRDLLQALIDDVECSSSSAPTSTSNVAKVNVGTSLKIQNQKVEASYPNMQGVQMIVPNDRIPVFPRAAATAANLKPVALNTKGGIFLNPNSKVVSLKTFVQAPNILGQTPKGLVRFVPITPGKNMNVRLILQPKDLKTVKTSQQTVNVPVPVRTINAANIRAPIHQQKQSVATQQKIIYTTQQQLQNQQKTSTNVGGGKSIASVQSRQVSATKISSSKPIVSSLVQGSSPQVVVQAASGKVASSPKIVLRDAVVKTQVGVNVNRTVTTSVAKVRTTPIRQKASSSAKLQQQHQQNLMQTINLASKQSPEDMSNCIQLHGSNDQVQTINMQNVTFKVQGGNSQNLASSSPGILSQIVHILPKTSSTTSSSSTSAFDVSSDHHGPDLLDAADLVQSLSSSELVVDDKLNASGDDLIDFPTISLQSLDSTLDQAEECVEFITDFNADDNLDDFVTTTTTTTTTSTENMQ